MNVPVCLTNSYLVDVGESRRTLETILRAVIGVCARGTTPAPRSHDAVT